MPKDHRNKRKRPPTVAEAQRALESAMRREAAGAHTKTRRVDLANLDTPDVTHAEQYAEFLNRPGRFYVGQFEIALDDEPLGQKLTTQTTFKADDQQLLYLVEVLRQVRGALGAHTRITLAPAEPHVEQRRLAGPPTRTPTTDEADDLRGVMAVHRASREALRRATENRAPCVHCAEDAQATPITAHERPATPEELAAVREMRARADARNGFTLPPANGHPPNVIPDGPPRQYGRDWVAEGQELDREFTREELVDMLPGQTRAELAQELGKAPENLGGTVHNADVMPEELAAELGVPVESLQRIAIQGGGYAWAVKPTPEASGGRHAAPDGDDQ